MKLLEQLGYIKVKRTLDSVNLYTIVARFCDTVAINKKAKNKIMNFSTTNSSYPNVFLNSCNGELVYGIIEELIVINRHQDANSGIHYNFHSIIQFKGTGETTGALYTGKLEYNTTRLSKPPVPEEFTDTIKLLLSSKDAPDFFLHMTFHMTINANGEITSTLFNVRSECK